MFAVAVAVAVCIPAIDRRPPAAVRRSLLADHTPPLGRANGKLTTDYEMVRKNPPTGRVPVTLVVVPHRTRDDDSFCLVTNCAVSKDAAEPLAEANGRRWGIETSYRKIGEFLPRTSSPTFAVRLFEFLFAVAMYNLWILVCLFLAEQRESTDRPAVSTVLLRLFVLSVPDG